MEKRTTSPYPAVDRVVMALIGVVLVIGTGLFVWADRAHDWRYYQYEFRRQVTEQFGADKAAELPTGVQQIWVADLGRADRCITCHQAINYKGFEQAEQPWQTHPVEPLAGHPVEDYGCTSCHGGQGWAIDTDAAHGQVAHWEEPLLSRTLGQEYSLATDKNALMQMSCNVCHRYDRETKGAGAINLAKQLVNEKGCRACHVINGFGGTIGPDLTDVGEKPPEQYEFSRLSGQLTAFAWHVAHFKDPRALTEGTVMPNFNFTTEQAQALSMLMLSWRRHDVPARYVSGAPRTDPRSEEELRAEEAMKTGPGAWFVETGCFVCHSIAALGVKSPAQIGPDLSNAVEDVQSRFGKTIDAFLANPTGTMSVVLSRQIILTPDEKQTAIQKLREAFAEYERQRAAAQTPARSQ
ncbi:MAG TPA: c-type cytochrome [Vicinamibacterales bacterium]|nr:c-type cytochrome [Vicinamibacterales bacterium]